MKYFELKKEFEKLFSDAKIEETSDIDWIIVEITGRSRSMLPFFEISDEEYEKILEAINLRLKHIPIGYIFGKTDFYGRDFFVTNDTLIPRIDTEILIESIVKKIKDEERVCSILDIGTGSGAIAITIQKETNSKVTAVDISEKALFVAQKNAKNLDSDVEFIKSDLFKNLKNQKFDFIVSNPPYIKSSVIEVLEPEVRLNEPILALDGGESGLKFYEKIIFDAKNYLTKKGYLFFEIGFDQANEVSSLMEKDFEDIKVIKDYSNNDRVVYGRLRG